MNYSTVNKILLSLLWVSFILTGPYKLFGGEQDSLLRLYYSVKSTDVDKMKITIRLAAVFQQTDLPRSVDFARKAVALSKKVDNKKGEAMAYNLLAIAYNMQQHHDSAQFFYNKALVLFKEIADSTGLMHVYNNLGVLCKNKGQFARAVEYYKSALNVARDKRDTVGMIQSLNNLGIVMYNWKHYSTSVDFYNEALSLLRRKKDSYRIAVVLNNLGELYMAMGQKESAFKSYKEAWEISRKGKWINPWVGASLNLGKYYSEKAEYKKAEDYLKTALKVSDSVAYNRGKALALTGLARVYYLEGERDKALEFIQRGCVMADSLSLPEVQIEAYEMQHKIYEALADYKNAYKAYLKYISLKDTLFNQNSRKEISLLRTQYETDKKEQEIKILEKERALQDLKNKKNKQIFLLTLAFLVLLFLVLVGVIERRIHRQKLLRDQLQREKSELEGRLFRAQMNPHFIFNALNSIASYIENKKNNQAINYLIDFAQLMRFNLNSTINEYISLVEELEALKIYIRLEQLRFGIEYEVLMLNVEDPSTVFLPPMMVQPFVENAIKHGLSRIEGNRQLKVSYELQKEFIEVEVIDNGLGYSISEQEKKDQGNRHTSLATQLTRERLDYYSRALKKKFSFSIGDITDDSNKVHGTRVIIKLPCYIE